MVFSKQGIHIGDFASGDHQFKWKNEKRKNYLVAKYQVGVEDVEEMVETWNQMEEYVDDQRFEKTQMLLQIQLKEARWWRDAFLLYFQQFSGMELPDFIPEPEHNLKYYQSLEFPYAPGISPSWH